MSAAPTPALDRIRIGSAPNPWGSGSRTTSSRCRGQRFLDEVAQAGCPWIEFGRADPAILADVVADEMPFGPAVSAA